MIENRPLELKRLFLGDRPTLTLRGKSLVYQGIELIQPINAYINEGFSQVHLNFGNESTNLEGRVFTMSPSYGLYVHKTQGPYVLASANYDLTDGASLVVNTQFTKRDLTVLFGEIQGLQIGNRANELFNVFLRDYYMAPGMLDEVNSLDTGSMNFSRGTVFKNKTSVIETTNKLVAPYEIPGEHIRIGIGEFYGGSLPKGTEEIMLINLPGVGQIIKYMHRREMPDGGVEMQAFRNSFKPIGQELKVETFVR